MDPIYYFILSIVAILTAALTVLKINSMRSSAPDGNGFQLKPKIVNLEQKLFGKRDVSFCDERYETMQRELAKGDKNFKAIYATLSKQGELLARMDERVTYLAERQGFKKGGK